MRLSAVHNIADLREAARSRLPKMVFDYIDGGADDELTLTRNVTAFDDIELVQNVLTDVSVIDGAVDIMGAKSKLPFVISPTATSRLFYPRAGERAVSAAADKAGIPYAASTLASVLFEDIPAAPDKTRWLQLYVWRDRDLVGDMLQKAKAAGYSALILTVDTPVAGNRERDPRNRFSIPPRINLNNAINGLMAPGYMFDMLTSPRIGPVNVDCDTSTQSIIDLINNQFDPSVTWDYLSWLRSEWDGPIAIKGISKADDARRAIDFGADCIWLSNHGGRQLDTAPAPITLLPEISKAVAGDAQIVMDSGIRRGSHIVKALALGADAVAIGRPYLYGLSAFGQKGVEKAVSILSEEFERTMALIGVASVKDLGPESLRH